MCILSSNEYTIVLNCGHAMHVDCFIMHDLRNCPMCRKEIKIVIKKTSIFHRLLRKLDLHKSGSLMRAVLDRDPLGTQIMSYTNEFFQNNQCALRTACKVGDTKILKILLNHPRADPGISGNECITNCAKYEHYECAEIILRSEKINVTVPFMTFVWVIRRNNVRMLKILCSHWSFRRLKRRYIKTLIAEAVEYGHYEQVKYLADIIN